MVDDEPEGGGFLLDPADSILPEAQPTAAPRPAAKVNRIPLRLVAKALDELDLPSDQDILSVFELAGDSDASEQDADEGDEDEAPKTAKHGEAMIRRSDFLKVCAALLAGSATEASPPKRQKSSKSRSRATVDEVDEDAMEVDERAGSDSPAVDEYEDADDVASDDEAPTVNESGKVRRRTTRAAAKKAAVKLGKRAIIHTDDEDEEAAEELPDTYEEDSDEVTVPPPSTSVKKSKRNGERKELTAEQRRKVDNLFSAFFPPSSSSQPASRTIGLENVRFVASQLGQSLTDAEV